jgi:hypothetical protein
MESSPWTATLVPDRVGRSIKFVALRIGDPVDEQGHKVIVIATSVPH